MSMGLELLQEAQQACTSIGCWLSQDQVTSLKIELAEAAEAKAEAEAKAAEKKEMRHQVCPMGCAMKAITLLCISVGD